MDRAGVVERVGRVSAVTADPAADVAAIESALVALQQVQAWADAQHATLVPRLASQVSFPEQTIAESSKCSLAAATKTKDRSDTLERTPELAGALANGAITAGHVDAVTKGSKSLSDEQRQELFDRVDELADVAASATIDEFAKRVRLEIKKIQEDDGVDRLERQRRNTRCNTWTDAEGMWNIRGRFDPVTGVALAAKLDGAVEAMFAEEVPDGCPTDPIEKQKFLTGHALARLIDGAGGGSRPGRPEYVVVIDADAPEPTGPIAEWSIPVEIPAQVVAELSREADVHAVVVRNGVVLHAPGQLDLGRTTRLANRAQRRALRAMYRGCAIPGCSVSFDRCKLHHLEWWRHGGRTDLANMLPLCTKHHTKVHHDGWIIELGPNRELSLRLPDGSIHNTGPPSRRAA